MRIAQTLIQSGCNFSDLHTVRMHFLSDLHTMLVQNFRPSQNHDANVSDLHKILYAVCRDYRQDSCILASQLAMRCSVMRLRPASGSVQPQPHTNCGTSQALCTPQHKIADSLRLWALSVLSTPQIGGRLRLLAPP